MCINCMLCYSACPVYALDPDFSVRRRRAGVAVQPGLVTKVRRIGDVLAADADGAGVHPGGRMFDGCPKASILPRQRYKLTTATHALKKLLFPLGGRMSAYQPVERYCWARRRSYLEFMLHEISCIFVAGFVLYLVLCARRWRGRQDSYPAVFGLQRNPVVVVLERRRVEFPCCCMLFTWFGSAPRAMVIRNDRRICARVCLLGTTRHGERWFR